MVERTEGFRADCQLLAGTMTDILGDVLGAAHTNPTAEHLYVDVNEVGVESWRRCAVGLGWRAMRCDVSPNIITSCIASSKSFHSRPTHQPINYFACGYLRCTSFIPSIAMEVYQSTSSQPTRPRTNQLLPLGSHRTLTSTTSSHSWIEGMNYESCTI